MRLNTCGLTYIGSKYEPEPRASPVGYYWPAFATGCGPQSSPIVKTVFGSFPSDAHEPGRFFSMKTTEDFDEAFDRSEDVVDALDRSSARRPGEEQRRVNVDFPAWMVAALDAEARHLGVTRQSIIKMWLAERLDDRGTGAA